MTTTPEIITIPLDQLRAFDLNPRITRNPKYDAIKQSIKNRGLEHPPKVTKRPDESFYIIASGGNTRLAILNELWQETQDKNFWNVTCNFYPWPSSQSLKEGNLQCLFGHMVEGDLHGSLTFIERSLAVQNAAQLILALSAGPVTQSELVRLINQSGYIIQQPLYSKMMATINLLLPHIPELLYNGLPKLAIDRLLTLRSSALKFWDAQASAQHPLFDDIFATALAEFDGPLEGFALENFRDELTGLISQTLEIDYNTVALVTDAAAQKRQSLLGSPAPVLPEIDEQRHYHSVSSPASSSDSEAKSEQKVCESNDTTPAVKNHGPKETSSPVPSSAERIDSQIDNPDYDAIDLHENDGSAGNDLASQAEQCARQLAKSAGLEHLILSNSDHGFRLANADASLTNESLIYYQALAFLTNQKDPIWPSMLVGSATAPAGFSNSTIDNLIQLIRLMRRLYKQQREETR